MLLRMIMLPWGAQGGGNDSLCNPNDTVCVEVRRYIRWALADRILKSQSSTVEHSMPARFYVLLAFMARALHLLLCHSGWKMLNDVARYCSVHILLVKECDTPSTCFDWRTLLLQPQPHVSNFTDSYSHEIVSCSQFCPTLNAQLAAQEVSSLSKVGERKMKCSNLRATTYWMHVRYVHGNNVRQLAQGHYQSAACREEKCGIK
jgi:hypothetical protein